MGSIRERLEAFRKTIPDDEGYTVRELAELPAIAACEPNITDVIVRNKWCIQQWVPEKRRRVRLLVNPKTLAKYAAKSEKPIK